jgi:hypothetical protein
MTGSRPHVVCITRWREHYAAFERYLDHVGNAVTYVVSPIAAESVPGLAADTRVVPATDDLPAIRAAVQELAQQYGPPGAVIALKEDDLLVGAALREEWGCPGPRIADVLPFRDKYVMSQAVAAAGLPIEPFALAPSVDAVADFGAAHGWPVVVKPRAGSASEGVTRVDGPGQLPGLTLPADALVQSFNPHHVYHVDGLWDPQSGGLRWWRAARYLNTCLAFRSGSYLGSVEEDDPALNAAIAEAAERYLAVLSRSPTVVHLEMFVDEDRRQCVFLEVGARVGGGETPFLWREVHGYDLIEQATLIQCGRRPRPPVGLDGLDDLDDADGLDGSDGPAARQPRGWHRPGGEVAGHLLIPSPVPPPARITAVTSMTGTLPGPYAEALPLPGDIVPLAPSFYEHVGGRFRFRGPSTAAVTDAILATAQRFEVHAVPIPKGRGNG